LPINPNAHQPPRRPNGPEWDRAQSMNPQLPVERLSQGSDTLIALVNESG
jgi:hypothetical protein